MVFNGYFFKFLCCRKTGRKFCELKLASKVLDSADRLRDTLIHEMCHQATWVISGTPIKYP